MNIEIQNLIENFIREEGWDIYDIEPSSEDIKYELSNESPDGEYFAFILHCNKDIKSINDALHKVCVDFDIDEQVWNWLNENHQDISDDSNVESLVEDAKAIQAMLKKLADDFRNVFIE